MKILLAKVACWRVSPFWLWKRHLEEICEIIKETGYSDNEKSILQFYYYYVPKLQIKL